MSSQSCIFSESCDSSQTGAWLRVGYISVLNVNWPSICSSFFVKASTSMNCIKPHPFSSLLGEGAGVGGLETHIFDG